MAVAVRVVRALWVLALIVVFGVVEGSHHQCPKAAGCNKTLSEVFKLEMFEGMFMHRNDRVSHAREFWSYGSFLSAANLFTKAGFGSEGGDDVQKRELAAFFAHVAHETSCNYVEHLTMILALGSWSSIDCE